RSSRESETKARRKRKRRSGRAREARASVDSSVDLPYRASHHNISNAVHAAVRTNDARIRECLIRELEAFGIGHRAEGVDDDGLMSEDIDRVSHVPRREHAARRQL